MTEPVTIMVDSVEAETDKAILCLIDSEKVWVPKSQIDEDSEVYSLKSGKEGGEMLVSAWWADQKGIVT